MKKPAVGVIISLSMALALIFSIMLILSKKQPKGIIQTTAVIEAREVNLAPKITERIKRINFEEGDYIKENDIAVLLDDEKIKAEYAQAEANLEVAKASLLDVFSEIEKANIKIEDTKRDLGRLSKLLEKNLISQNDKDKAQTSYELAVADLDKANARRTWLEAGVKQAEAAFELARIRLKDASIASTISGIVTFRPYEPGEMVAQGAAILTIVDTQNLWARVNVEETQVARIKLGDAATVKVDAFPNREFRGRVVEINSEGEFATQRDTRRGRQDIKTFRVKVKIDDTAMVLKQGMTATVIFL